MLPRSIRYGPLRKTRREVACNYQGRKHDVDFRCRTQRAEDDRRIHDSHRTQRRVARDTFAAESSTTIGFEWMSLYTSPDILAKLMTQARLSIPEQ